MKSIAIAAGLVVLAGSSVGLYRYALPPVSEPVSATSLAGSKSPESSLLQFLEQPRPVPEVRFTDSDHAAMSLADFRGKVVLLNIWATWCMPCREEMPTLDALQAQLGGTNFEVVTLSIDRDGTSKVQNFYEEIRLEHLNIYVEESPGAVSRDLNIIGLPTTLLIDRNGRELGRLIGPAEWDSPELVEVIEGAIEMPRTARTEPTGLDGSLQAVAGGQSDCRLWTHGERALAECRGGHS